LRRLVRTFRDRTPGGGFIPDNILGSDPARAITSSRWV